LQMYAREWNNSNWPVTWLNPRSTGVAGGLVDSKEHWGRPVAWLIPRSTGVAGGLVDSKEHWGDR
jgi:hypothetical protein